MQEIIIYKSDIDYKEKNTRNDHIFIQQGTIKQRL